MVTTEAARMITASESPSDIGLLADLRVLDSLIARAVVAADRAYGPEAAAERFRGLYVARQDVDTILATGSVAATLTIDPDEAIGTGWSADGPLATIAGAYGLSRFEVPVVLLALAPELDLRYEKLFAFLQDDVTRRRPTVDLALNLLCSSPEEKLAARACFTPDSPLVRHRLVQLAPDASSSSLLACVLRLDPQIVAYLLGEDVMDARIAGFCRIERPAPSDWATEAPEMLWPMAAEAWQTAEPLRLYFEGARGLDQRRVAESLAGGIGAGLLVADLSRLPAGADIEMLAALSLREALIRGAILYVDDGAGVLSNRDDSAQRRAFFDGLAADGGIVIIAGHEPIDARTAASAGVISVQFAHPDAHQRREAWEDALSEAAIELDAVTLDHIAARYHLTRDEITVAVAVARAQARLLERAPGPKELLSAANKQTGHELAALAVRVESRATWDDIVLPNDAIEQMREICARVNHGDRVFNDWGFGRKLSSGKGNNALFAGPSGSGKTMAAEVIGQELGLDVYRIDLAGVVSKYIGDTEKNLDRIFRAARSTNAILFFDEADALFGKRSEVRDSHDRYANIEISYLLEKFEGYEGIAILATNLRANLDQAFTRRLAFTVYFPFPEDEDRRRIWQRIWPPQTPLASDIDFDFLGRQFRLSGGNIKNVALSAAFLAAEETSPVSMAHVRRALRREYQKMGKLLSDEELAGSDAVIVSIGEAT